MAGSVRFSDSFNGLEDPCKFTYLDFFRDLSCNRASTTCWAPVVKTWLKPERDEAEIGKKMYVMSARWVRDREKGRDQQWMGSGSGWTGAFRLTGGMLAVPTDGNEREIGFENRTESQRRLSVRVSGLLPWKYT